MQILHWQWHSFLKTAVTDAFAALGIEADLFFYQLTDWEHDEKFREKFRAALRKKPYTAVFSINFNPMISDLCEEAGIPYVSWVYDSPIHIRDLAPLKNSVNRTFFFDRGQAEEYRAAGYPAEYLPLAGDVRTFQRTVAGTSDAHRYASELAFVGQLYANDYAYYLRPLSPYQRGYLEGILGAQGKVYGGYLLPSLLTDELLAGLNEQYKKASGGTASIEKRELEFLLAQEITSRERLLALSLLSKRCMVELYGAKKDERLPERGMEQQNGVRYHDYADYYSVMPLIFSQAKINLNISLKCIRTGIPLRVFDVLACGGFLITNYQAELPEYFNLGEDLVCYGSIEELVALTDFYRKHDTERQRIAENGMRRIKADYTPEKQLQKIFQKI